MVFIWYEKPHRQTDTVHACSAYKQTDRHTAQCAEVRGSERESKSREEIQRSFRQRINKSVEVFYVGFSLLLSLIFLNLSKSGLSSQLQLFN